MVTPTCIIHPPIPPKQVPWCVLTPIHNSHPHPLGNSFQSQYTDFFSILAPISISIIIPILIILINIIPILMATCIIHPIHIPSQSSSSRSPTCMIRPIPPNPVPIFILIPIHYSHPNPNQHNPNSHANLHDPSNPSKSRSLLLFWGGSCLVVTVCDDGHES